MIVNYHKIKTKDLTETPVSSKIFESPDITRGENNEVHQKNVNMRYSSESECYSLESLEIMNAVNSRIAACCESEIFKAASGPPQSKCVSDEMDREGPQPARAGSPSLSTLAPFGASCDPDDHAPAALYDWDPPASEGSLHACGGPDPFRWPDSPDDARGSSPGPAGGGGSGGW